MAATAEGPQAPQPPLASQPTRVVELDWRSVLVVIAVFVTLVTATGLARSLPRTVAALIVATLIALALNPAVSGAARRVPGGRRTAVAAVLTLGAAAVAVIALLLVPPAVRQAQDLQEELPQVIADLSEMPLVGDDLVRGGVPERLERTIEELPERLAGDAAPLGRFFRSLAGGLATAATTLLLAVTLLLDGPRLARAALRLVPPHHRTRSRRIGDLAYRVVGRYVAGSLSVAGVAGIATLIAGLLLGVPLTPLLAVWVAIWDLVPQIGGAAGGIPFVLLGFTQGPVTGLACAAFFVVYLQIENNILGPLLVGNAVKLSPPATMTAALIGVSAGGVVGALVAVPLVGAVKVIYLELRPPRTATPTDGGHESPSVAPAP